MAGVANPGRVRATPAALDLAGRLAARHGPLAFFQSGGCCDGSSPICLLDGELPPGPQDLLLGHLAEAPFYVDQEQYDRWGRPSFMIDVGAGPAEGFSLSAPDGHFITRTCNPGGS